MQGRRKMEGTSGRRVHDTRQDSVPGVLACIMHAGPENQLQGTPAHGALQVGDGERKNPWLHDGATQEHPGERRPCACGCDAPEGSAMIGPSCPAGRMRPRADSRCWR